MEFIKPRSISGEIMTLLDEADEKVIIVSPYYKISNWQKLLNSIDDLKKRKIDIEFYVREDEIKSIQEVNNIGFRPIQIPNLHCKLYLNEKYAIFSSMNLHFSSDTNSLDIGYKTTSQDEYNELYDFYERYIKKSTSTINTSQNSHSEKNNIDWKKYLYNKLIPVAGRNLRFDESYNLLKINTGTNNYSIFIDKGSLHIEGILSNSEFINAKGNPHQFTSKSYLIIRCNEGGNGQYDTIQGRTSRKIKSNNISNLSDDEAISLANDILSFISLVDDFKKNYYKR